MCPRSSIPRVTSMQAVQLDEVDAVEATPAGLSERADGCGFPGNRHSGRSVARYVWGTCPRRSRSRRCVKRYGGHVALDGVTLRVPAGTVYGFLGPNGAGQDDDDADPARAAPRRRRHGPRARSRPVERRARGARPDRLPAVAARACTSAARAASSSTTSADWTASPPVRRGRALRRAAAAATPTSTGRCAATRRACARSSRSSRRSSTTRDLAVLDEPTEGLDPLVQDGFVEILTARRARRPHQLPLVTRAVGDRGAVRPGGDHPRRPDRGRGDDRRAARRPAAAGDGAARRAAAGAAGLRAGVADGPRGAVYAHHGAPADLLRALADARSRATCASRSPGWTRSSAASTTRTRA